MANDTDMWNDIEHLEKIGKQQQADDLLELYRLKFIELDSDKEAEELREKYKKKYGFIHNYW